MTYEEMLLDDLKQGPICFHDKRAVGKRIELLTDLQNRGLITMRMVEVDEQESYLVVEGSQ